MSTRIEEAALVDWVMEHGGLDREAAEWAICTTATALGEALPFAAATVLAESLPERFARLTRPRRGPLGEIDTFYASVAAHEGTGRGPAREHAQIVCRGLGEVLPRAARDRVLFDVSPALAALFARAPSYPPPPRHAEASAAGHHTLAAGRPGSRHPVSESEADRAHAHSIAREANPHGETKLSSAGGLTQERLDESLATAHPDETRTIAGGGD